MIWNIPNILSLLRLVLFIPMLLVVYFGYENIFVWGFVVFQITDLLDGFIARRFNMQTEIGAKLDSYGDVCSYLLAFSGIAKFHNELFDFPYGIFVLIFLLVWLGQMLLSKIKYGVWIYGLHLISSKVSFWVQSGFIVVLFTAGFMPVLFYLAFFAGLFTELEAVCIYLVFKKPGLNAKSFFHLKKKTEHV